MQSDVMNFLALYYIQKVKNKSLCNYLRDIFFQLKKKHQNLAAYLLDDVTRTYLHFIFLKII